MSLFYDLSQVDMAPNTTVHDCAVCCVSNHQPALLLRVPHPDGLKSRQRGQAAFSGSNDLQSKQVQVRCLRRIPHHAIRWLFISVH